MYSLATFKSDLVITRPFDVNKLISKYAIINELHFKPHYM